MVSRLWQIAFLLFLPAAIEVTRPGSRRQIKTPLARMAHRDLDIIRSEVQSGQRNGQRHYPNAECPGPAAVL